MTETLGAFLLGRIEEDVRVLDRDGPTNVSRATGTVVYRVVHWDERRLRLECEAKRQIVESGNSSSCGAHDPAHYTHYEERFGNPAIRHYPEGYAPGCDGCSAAEAGDRDHQRVMRLLALPYKHHRDYREEWAL